MIYIHTFRKPQKHDSKGDATRAWNYQKGDTVRIICYTNCEEAQLKINGVVVGETKKSNSETGEISWDILFKEGKVEAFGY